MSPVNPPDHRASAAWSARGCPFCAGQRLARTSGRRARGRTQKGSWLGLRQNPWLVAQSFDLGRGLGAAIGDDLLNDAQPCLDPLDMGGILGALLGGEVALR